MPEYENPVTRPQHADALVGDDEIIEGEPRHAFLIQLCLIAALIVAMALMAVVNRLVN